MDPTIITPKGTYIKIDMKWNMLSIDTTTNAADNIWYGEI